MNMNSETAEYRQLSDIPEFAEFAEKAGIKNTVPTFEFESVMNEEDYRNAIMNTRKNVRTKENVILTLFTAVLIFLTFRYKTAYYAGFGAICAYRVYFNLTSPKKKTEKYIARMKEKYYKAEINEHVFFLDDYLCFYDRIAQKFHAVPYSKFCYLYDKKDYLFLGYTESTGTYVSVAEFSDKEMLVKFIRQKCEGIRLMK